MMNLEDK
jgi:hypothetical protein